LQWRLLIELNSVVAQLAEQYFWRFESSPRHKRLKVHGTQTQ